ncbi:hypothetical protein N431DRAFT_343437 [Stipitochalara longipes BDJ]|nr:hypothetical protein N431DRAFT_343437 [Stipitochalara longipes BDJ]
MLSLEWDLGIRPKKDYSPQKRGRSLSDQCIEKIRFLHHKRAFDPALIRFREQATILYSGWVHKPKAERGVVPEATRNKPRPVTERERVQLLRLLLKILKEDMSKWITENTPSPARFRGSQEVDDSPLPLSLGPKPNSDPKRQRDEEVFSNAPIMFKKPRKPDVELLATNSTASESLATSSKTPQTLATSSKAQPLAAGSMLPPVTRPSANTSFASDGSSIFSRRQSYNSSWQPGTQETVPDVPEEELVPHTQAVKESFMNPQPDKASSTHYGTSSFEERMADVTEEALGIQATSPEPLLDSQTDGGEGEGLSQDLLGMAFGDDTLLDSEKEFQDSLLDTEKAFQDSLRQVFCELPPSLHSASLRVIYEITRVCLHAGVSFAEINFPEPAILDDYHILWRFLKGVPALEGKPFPERCSEKLWDLASGNFSDGFRGVVFSGALRFNSDHSSNSLLQFRLATMKLDLSHRLGRRFGHDRFLEIDMPDFTGRNLPKPFKAVGARGPEIIHNWLVSSRHPLVGRYWQPFFLKSIERKEKKREVKSDEDEFAAAHRFYCFAVDGVGFDRPDFHIGTTEQLLDAIRPIEENKHQPFLKLFTRTSLALSRNSATIVLEPDQIYYLPDIRYNKEVMTDGAGRMSQALAIAVANKLGLSILPSGFQARIGEAKGFWSVDHTSERVGNWIEIYASQCKWKVIANEESHPSNRTFEVLRWSSPLKPADLNLQFLPLLMDRSKSPAKMTEALATLLKGGLENELLAIQAAMDDPQLFRQWLRENHSNISERLKAGRVPYQNSLPVATEERLNMLLDVGFEPKKLQFMKDLALTTFDFKCKDLQKKLNITVGRSTYAYMVPDFSGVLEAGEVFIDFSSFADTVSGFAGTMLKGVDVLVARSPAHFGSDIQKVKAVFKLELIGLKDVIVFSTKGNPSLAAKLSGGDYDGDIAWVCWEPTIVNNFENADMPECPDLVKEGLIKQDLTTYEELVAGHAKPTTVFLKEAFAFNMQRTMLGICTRFKEDVCYTQSLEDKHDTKEAVWLSTLLSCLVDQSKQGYSFTEDDWTRFKNAVVKFTPKKPKYKEDDGHYDKNAKHIIDRLMYTAWHTIKTSMDSFHAGETAQHWDPDLVSFYKWARTKAETEPEWKTLLDDLDRDIQSLKAEWARKWPRTSRSFQHGEESKSEFPQKVSDSYAVFQAILPRNDTPLTQSLLRDCFDIEVSDWAHLRASALFYSYHRMKNDMSRFIWHMAGKQLALLKCYARSGSLSAMSPGMYAMLKPDAAYVRRAKANEQLVWDESISVTNAEEIEALRDDE